MTLENLYVILLNMRINENDIKIQESAIIIEKAARSLHNAARYIYAVGNENFYNIGVRDLFQVCLSDITRADILSNLGISPEHSGAFIRDEYAMLVDLLQYAFAVRLPYLRRFPDIKVKDKLFYHIYLACVERGAADPNGIVGETFESTLKSAKSNRLEPSFNGEWFRRWVYSCGSELSVIDNNNMFLLGCMDALLPLYYSKLSDMIADVIRRIEPV